MGIKIEPLSRKTLKEASETAVEVFDSTPNDEDYPPKWLKASLDFDKNRKVHEDFHVTSSRYWVALEKKKVLGVIGLYTLKYDESESYWLGWYCVNKKSRGKGVGKALLSFAINLAREDGKKWLRLYTSNEENEARANEVYDSLGFKLMSQNKLNRLVTSKRFRDFIKRYVYKELRL